MSRVVGPIMVNGMPMLEPPDYHHLRAAMGWLELGNNEEAKADIAKIAEGLRKHPDVLEVLWMIQATEDDWTAALATARSLIQIEPNRYEGWLHQAYALRRVSDGGLKAAWDALLPVASQFPSEPTIPYNLSCYACQMGQIDEARQWLQRAAGVGDKARIKSMALADPDLQALWKEVSEW